MSNLVLYRKYRPQTFAEIIGQEHVVQTITNAISSGAISHAYIFSGPRGSGKTTIARLLAKSANCRDRKPGLFEPCNKCSSCLEIMEARSLDFIEIDAASHRGIDEIRELRDGVKFAPVKEKYKIFVIDECFTGDHLITMADGSVKKISEIKNNEKVASIDLESGKIIDGQVKNWFKRETNRIIEIKTPQTYLRCTPTHRLWIIRGGGKEFLLVEAKDIKKGDFLLSPVFSPHIQKNNLKPWQLGFLALIQCDGHISKDSVTVQIEINKDRDYFKEIFEKGLKSWGIKEKPVIKTTSRGTRLIRVYSSKLKNILINLSCPEGKKGSKIDIPDVVFNAPLESIKAYIDTCFCCEGNVDFNKSLNLYRLHFNSTSDIFVKKLQLLIKKFGISTSFLKISKNKKNKNHLDQYRATLSHYNLKIFYQKIGLSLKRKNDALEGCSLEKERQDVIPIEKIILEKQSEVKLPCSTRAEYGIYPDSRQHLSRAAVENFIKLTKSVELNKFLQFRYEKIKKINVMDKKEQVYDFTVEGKHNFIANGICSSNCHQLTKEAANALLKTLEEPPSHAIFILATTEIHKMISTIISRCQRFDFRKLNLAEITGRLEFISNKENSRFEKSALELIALNSGGSVRDAESLLDQVLAFAGDLGKNGEIKIKDIKDLLGIADVEIIVKFVDLLCEKNAAGALRHLQEIFEKGYDPQEFAKALIRYLRQTLILKISMDSVNPVLIGLAKEDQEKMKAQSEKFSQKEIQAALSLFLDAENKTKYSSIPQLPLELATVDFINPKE